MVLHPAHLQTPHSLQYNGPRPAPLDYNLHRPPKHEIKETKLRLLCSSRLTSLLCCNLCPLHFHRCQWDKPTDCATILFIFSLFTTFFSFFAVKTLYFWSVLAARHKLSSGIKGTELSNKKHLSSTPKYEL